MVAGSWRCVVSAIMHQNQFSGFCCSLPDGVNKVTSKNRQKYKYKSVICSVPPIATKISEGCPVADVITYVECHVYPSRSSLCARP